MRRCGENSSESNRDQEGLLMCKLCECGYACICGVRVYHVSGTRRPLTPRVRLYPLIGAC